MKRLIMLAALMLPSISYSMSDEQLIQDIRETFETQEEFDGKVSKACIVRDNVVTQTCVTVDRRNRSLFSLEVIDETDSRNVPNPRDPAVIEGGSPGGSNPLNQSGIRDLITTMGKAGFKGKMRIKYKTPEGGEFELEIEVAGGTGGASPN